jgi:hypothetical protein
MLSYYLHLDFQNRLFPPGSPNKTFWAFLFPPVRATYPAHFILLDLIVLIIFGVMYKLCNFLLSLNTFSVFVRDVLPRTTAPKCTLRGDRLILKSTFHSLSFA